MVVVGSMHGWPTNWVSDSCAQYHSTASSMNDDVAMFWKEALHRILVNDWP